MKINSFVALAATSAIILLSSCGGGDSEWPQDQQDAFVDNCILGAEQDPAVNAEEYCNCFLDKMMKKYPKPEDVENMDMGDMMEMAEKCK